MKSIVITFAAIASLGILGGACTGKGNANNQAADTVLSPREQLRATLMAAETQGRVLFGHDDDPVYGHTWVGDTGRSDVLEVVGQYPAIMNWDMGGIEVGDTANLDRVPFSRMRAEIQAQHARGGINAFSWHPVQNAKGGGDSWNVNDSTVVTWILADSATNAAFRAQVASVAAFFNSLTDADGQKIPVIFRPWHENSGSWFWWGAPYCTPDEYRQLWQITREEFDRAGVDQVLWAYSPDRCQTIEQYASRYPGDELVDIVGTDIYHFGGAEGTDNFRADAARNLAVVTEFASEHGKIAAFTETGLEGQVIPDWWTEVLLPLLKEYPVAYVVLWRNAHDKPDHFYTPYPGHPAEESFKAFAADSTIIFVNDIKNL